ncbi:uncharacterized protein IUM83_13009 [Phytophthora cinnamomi]|uniref:uncharacterized protein n=1 Tax=Phytophthora cinnamomi TaxID=4785 RepID=UPI00355A27A7|nr:hypothetical protein IUM83_13009 [Phytophthora cinnamomi]
MQEGQLPSVSSPRPPPSEVRNLGEGFYVQACFPGADSSPPSPSQVTIVGEPFVLLGAVDAIDSEDSEDDEELLEAVVGAPVGSALISVRDGDDELVTVADRRGAASPSTLMDAVDAMDSDDEELQGDRHRTTTTTISGAALDLCPAVDLTNLADTDSSSSSSEEEDFNDSDNDVDFEDGQKDDSHDELADKRGGVRLSSWESDYLSVNQVDAIIRSDMAKIEAKKPWRFVFRCLEMPFEFAWEDDPFDVFFMRWDDFWRIHGRAVWERDFWQPLLPGSTEYHRRKGRQFRAMRDFRELATDLEKRLGKQFRPSLCKRPHEGWWYRIEPIALRRLFLKGRNHYEKYLATRVKYRWPRGRKFLMERGLKPMWWLPDSSPSATGNGL